MTFARPARILLVIAVGRHHGIDDKKEKDLVKQLEALPAKIDQVVKMDDEIKDISEMFADKRHALFLGRGLHCPVAMEGA